MTEAEFPTVDQLGVAGDVMDILSAELEKARPQPGDVIAQSVDGQMKMTQRKNSTMVKMNGVELPERVKVFDRHGRPSYVPTAQLTYHLTKPAADAPGQRAFYRSPPPGTKEPVPIDQTCDICLETGVRKKFYKKRDYTAHMTYYHPLEWSEMKEEEANKRFNPEMILKALEALGQRSVTAEKPKRAVEMFSCAKCGKPLKGHLARAAHVKKCQGGGNG